MLRRLTASDTELDNERLRQALSTRPGSTPIGQLIAREPASASGQISTLRIVPGNNGSPWLEATVTDGTGYLIALWTGRRAIAGVRPGQKVTVTGRPSPIGPGGRLLIYNPSYELL